MRIHDTACVAKFENCEEYLRENKPSPVHTHKLSVSHQFLFSKGTGSHWGEISEHICSMDGWNHEKPVIFLIVFKRN